MTSFFRHRAKLTVAGATTVACAAGAVFAFAGGGTAAAHSQLRQRSASTSTLQSTLSANYSVLQQNTSVAMTPLPAGVEQHPLLAHEIPALGLQLDDMRMAAGANGTDIWLIPGTSGYCVMETIPDTQPEAPGAVAGSCGTTLPASGLLGGDFSGSSGSDDELLLPDADQSVTATDADGNANIVSAIDGVAVVQGSYVSISDTGLSGEPESTNVAPVAAPAGLAQERKLQHKDARRVRVAHQKAEKQQAALRAVAAKKN